jgi:hypothetical protein
MAKRDLELSSRTDWCCPSGDDVPRVDHPDWKSSPSPPPLAQTTLQPLFWRERLPTCGEKLK